MKDFIVLVLICVLVILVASWFLYPTQISHLFKEPFVAARPSEGQSKADQAAKAAKRAQEASRVVSAPPKEASPVQPAPEPQVTPPPPAPPTRVPGLNEVKIGEERSAMEAEFGPPTLTTSADEDGRAVETWIYRSGRKQAVIKLMDGRVSAVSLQ
jgi:hypothetical protein